MNDKKLFRWLGLLILLPLALAVFGGDNFRYPCQDPANWGKDICQKPLCEVTRTCPEQIFKGAQEPMPAAGPAARPPLSTGACK